MIFAMQWLCNRKKDPCYRLSAPSWSGIVLCNCGCLQEDFDSNATHISTTTTTTTSIASTLIFVILLLKANLNRQISLASVVCFVLMILCGYSQ